MGNRSYLSGPTSRYTSFVTVKFSHSITLPMAKQQLVLLTVVVVTLSTLELVHAAPLSVQDQYQAALQQVAVLKGNGTFKDCCDVRIHHVNTILALHEAVCSDNTAEPCQSISLY